MYSANIDIKGALADFSLENVALPYFDFIPRLYNFCRSLDFEPSKILPSLAFCSDENQGYLNILIAKHFGAFPFDHGRVGGIIATDRHGPHAEHGKDLVILHASHAGYDPESRSFGSYHRRHTENFETTASCGKIESVIEWYITQYNFAKENIFLHLENDEFLISIDNQILNEKKTEGLLLHLHKLVEVRKHGEFRPKKAYSTSKCFASSSHLRNLIGDSAWPNQDWQPIGTNLLPELFSFKRHISGDPETHGLLEENLISPMPWIVSAQFPLLTAAQANTQVEFDRAYRTLLNFKGHTGKRVLFISGLNIDISPHETQEFPLTFFVPWAAFVRDKSGHCSVLEQKTILNRLLEQNDKNPDEVDFEIAIQKIKETKKPFLIPSQY